MNAIRPFSEFKSKTLKPIKPKKNFISVFHGV